MLHLCWSRCLRLEHPADLVWRKGVDGWIRRGFVNGAWRKASERRRFLKGKPATNPTLTQTARTFVQLGIPYEQDAEQYDK